MLTARGSWLLFTVLFVFAIGAFAVPYYSVVPVLVGITLLAWFFVQWALFQTRSNGAVSRLRVRRQVTQGDREVPMVWSGLGFQVRVTIENPSVFDIPFAVLEDRAAVATQRIEGASEIFTTIPAGGTVEIAYTLKAPSPGVLRFEGIRVRVADLHGFFYRRVFIREAIELLALPPLTDNEGKQRATKRFNTLPPPGIHRLRRPGSGSELLDLRDYRPGDPPKMIAWKPSARRDRLIVKEYENDVPVRAVIFLDTSEGVRLGPPGNTLLTRLASVAAAVAQSSAANRDLVGFTTFDEHEAKTTAPARTKIHMINVLRRLAEVSSLQPGVTGVPPEQLTRRAYPLAQEIYPELMTKHANSMPLGRLWIPLLDRKYGWMVLLIVLIGLGVFFLGCSAMIRTFTDRQSLTDGSLYADASLWARKWFISSVRYAFSLMPAKWPILFQILWLLLMFVVTFFPLATLALIFWFVHGARGWTGDYRKELTRRKQLGTLFALQDGAGVDAIERYVFDDEVYAKRVAVFLQHHLLRCPVPLYNDDGTYRFRCAGKALVLAEAIIRSVGRARDNEIFVILADLAELGADLDPVAKACRVARARHHQVLVIVPWPADVPSPDDPDGATTPVAKTNDDDEDTGRRNPWSDPKKPKGGKDKKAAERKLGGPTKLVRQSLTKQYHETFKTLRRELSRAGATVMRVNDGDPARLVLDRLDRLRGMRSRR